MAMFSERILGETPELRRRGRADALHRPPRGRRPELLEQMDWAEERPPATTASRSTSPSTTAAGRRSSTPRGPSRAATEEEFRAHLYAPEMHDPDLIIRTSGEQRLSNYLMWQSAYSELALHRGPVAGLLARGLRGRARRVRRPQAPLRGPLMASRARRRAAAAGRRGSDLLSAHHRRDPGARVRDRRSSTSAAPCSRSGRSRSGW